VRRLSFPLAATVLAAALLSLATEHSAADGEVREGGTFRITFTGLDSADPARSYSAEGSALFDLTCARLMTHPDAPPPAGYRLVPEVAAASPRVSRDRKTWTFTLRSGRSGFRFSNGQPVRASAFARAINRTLAPEMQSPGAQYTQDIVGADAVLAGKTKAASGISARGNRLVIRLKRPVPDFPARTTMPFFCAVPPTLPADPEGVGAFPAAGPYYVDDYRPDQRVVIRRNRYYRGGRRPRIDKFEVDLTANSFQDVVGRIERGEADWGRVPAAAALDPSRRLVAKYGVNRSRLWVKPGLTRRAFVLNTERPLFRNNPQLRRAVNFAVNRAAVVRAAGSPRAVSLTEQYLPPALPGFRNVHIYPLRKPDLLRAGALARGHRRHRKAVLYIHALPIPIAHAQAIKRDLAGIGLDVEVEPIPPAAYFARLERPGEPFDIASVPWSADYLDPYSYINLQLEGRFVGIGQANYARFRSRSYDRLMRGAAGRQGRARYRAYGALDVRLARDTAPLLVIGYDNEATFVSRRVGCVVLNPGLDLVAACLKR
jgi:peptide/nickel transport system substrate-binding protein